MADMVAARVTSAESSLQQSPASWRLGVPHAAAMVSAGVGLTRLVQRPHERRLVGGIGWEGSRKPKVKLLDK